jgi:hypothetical protein
MAPRRQQHAATDEVRVVSGAGCEEPRDFAVF